MFFGFKSVGLSAAALVSCIGLAGCGGTGETVGEALGYEQKGPDEMTVIKRPPLIVPPDYNLRPPRPNEPRSNANAASRTARSTLTGTPAETAGQEQIATPNGVPAASGNAADRAKATLTGQASGDQTTEPDPGDPAAAETGEIAAVVPDVPAEPGPSAGQSALLNRSNKVVRDVEALTETRDENRIDGDLLRRLVVWKPATAKVSGGEAQPGSGKSVEIVRREQTLVSPDSRAE